MLLALNLKNLKNLKNLAKLKKIQPHMLYLSTVVTCMEKTEKPSANAYRED